MKKNSYKIKSPQEVRDGDIGFDYNDEKAVVIDICKGDEFEAVTEFCTSGWLSAKEAEEFKTSDFWLVAVKGDEYGYFGGKGTEVFIYGANGFYVKEDNKK